jgi:ABC-2 type transport system permease protein
MMREDATVGGVEPPPIVNAPYRFWGGLSSDVRAMFEQRSLVRSFIARELRQRYKGSFLGWGWALVRPLVMLVVYGVAVGVFLGANKSIPQFAVYLYTGLVAWGYFSTIVTGSVTTLPENAGLINKAAFQKELLIVAAVVVAAIDLLIQTSVLIVGYFAYGAWPAVSTLWWLIPGFALATLLGLGLGLVLSAANVYFRDVGYFTEVALQVGFWLVPIIYSFSMVSSSLSGKPLLLDIYSANPIIPVVSTFRLALWPAVDSTEGASQLMPIDQMTSLMWISFVGSVAFIWLAQRFFARVSGNLAQEL